MVQLVVARIGRPQGLRGEVNIEVRTDDPAARFRVGASLLTEPPERGPLTLSSVRHQSGRTILGFQDCTDRTAAEGLRGVLLVVDSDDNQGGNKGSEDSGTPGAPGTDADPEEWYDHELIGLRAEGVRGELLGAVVRVDHGPAQDLLIVRPPAGGEVLVPFVLALVPIVDVRGGRVVIDPPGGLFEDAEDAEDAGDAEDTGDTGDTD